MDAFEKLNQPPLAPPGWVFPVVWTGLFAMMGTASYLIARLPETVPTPSGTARQVSSVFVLFFKKIPPVFLDISNVYFMKNRRNYSFYTFTFYVSLR